MRTHGEGGVVRPFVNRRLRGDRGFGIGGDGQGLVLDLDGLRPVRGGIGALGEHDGHALAHIAHPLVGEHGHLEGAALVAAAIGGGHGALDLGEVGRRPYRSHPRQALGRFHGYLDDAGVGMAAAHHGHVEHARALEIIHVTSGATDETPIFLAPGRGADQGLGRGHSGSVYAPANSRQRSATAHPITESLHRLGRAPTAE